MPTVFLNGRFFGDSDPVPMVSALDAGLQHGVGLFETMLAGTRDRRVWIMGLQEHMDRLAGSSRDLGLSDQLRTGALGDAIGETVRRSGHERARVRLTVTGGDLNLLAAGGAARIQADPTVLIVVQPATVYPLAMIDRGVMALIAGTRVTPIDPCAGHKTLNYWWRLRELQEASARGGAEALVFTVANHLAGGCVSNAMVVSGGVLLTPLARGEEQAAGGAPGAALASPVLPGVTRQWAIDAAAGMGVTCRRERLTISDLLGADEVFLTNSSWGVLPVVRIEAAAVGRGEPGPVARALSELWAREARELSERA